MSELNELNLSFSCGQRLSESDLNTIVGGINSTIRRINDIESNQNSEQNNNNSEIHSLGTVLLFKGFDSEDSATLSDEHRKMTDPPGWESNSNINSNQILYMISAETDNGNYLTYGEQFIWRGPYRVGSSNNTDGTGSDDNGYNYIYCRTSDYNTPSISNHSNWNNFVNLIEDNPLKSFTIDSTVSVQGNSINYNTTKDEWTDHPLGITKDIKCEWQIGFKYNVNQWEYAFGPICISHWGKNGLDGDGFEYIFYLVGQEVDGQINGYTVPQLGPTYTGKYRNPSGSGFISVTNNVEVSSTEYQNDDFIPIGWQDEPQAVDETHTKQYVSTRKRQGGQEVTDPWTAFTEPKLWNVYASDGYKVTLDNDTVFVDDDVSNEALQIVSETPVHLWNGDQEITRTGNNTIVTITKSGSYFNNYITPAIVGSGGGITTTNWGTQIILTNNIRGFCLVIKDGVSEPLPEKTEQIIFTLTKDNKTATRIQTFEVKNFNEGQAYQLQVTPNTLGIEKSGSGYVLRSDSESIKISAISATQKGVKQEIIHKSVSLISNLETGLYIEVLKSDGSSQSPIGSISQDSGTELTCNLSGITPMSNDTRYIQVNLYYKNLNNSIKVDSETIDFSIPGNDSNVAGPSGYNSATISLYRRSSTTLTNSDLPSLPLYYKFSNRKLYTTNTGDTEATNLNSWSYTIPSGTGECYIIQSNVSSQSDICEVTNWSDPVIFIQNVQSGEVGKMFYMQGVWDPNKTYAISDLTIPVVFYEGTEKYYYLNPDFVGNSIGNIPGSSTFGDNNDIWLEAENFGLVITEGIFSDFAKLGSAIISGDFMFSQNGYINRNLYTNGDTYTTNKTAPAYIWFYPQYNAYVNSNVLLVKTFKNVTFTDIQISNYVSDFFFAERNKFNNYRFIVISDNSNLKFSMNNNSNSFSWISNSGINKSVLSDNNYQYIIDLNYRYIEESYNLEQFRGSTRKLYVHGNGSINLIEVKLECESFKPNWCIDLRTGKMIAGQGNFIVNPDGSIEAASGNFIINPDGSIEAAGGKFRIDKNGNIIMDGNISSGNITIKNADIYNNFNTIVVPNGAIDNESWFSYEVQYNGAKWNSSSDDFACLNIDATFSNIINIIPKTNSGYNKNVLLILPYAEDYLGKTLDIYVGGSYSEALCMELTSLNYQGIPYDRSGSNSNAYAFVKAGAIGDFGQTYGNYVTLLNNSRSNCYPHIKVVAVQNQSAYEWAVLLD